MSSTASWILKRLTYPTDDSPDDEYAAPSRSRLNDLAAWLRASPTGICSVPAGARLGAPLFGLPANFFRRLRTGLCLLKIGAVDTQLRPLLHVLRGAPGLWPR